MPDILEESVNNHSQRSPQRRHNRRIRCRRIAPADSIDGTISVAAQFFGTGLGTFAAAFVDTAP